MALWGKKKNQVKETYIEKPIEPTVIQEQRKMAEIRETLDELIAKLKELQSPSFKDIALRATKRNEELIRKNAEKYKMYKENNPNHIEYIEERENMEEGLYLIPDDFDSCIKDLNGIVRIFEGYSAVDTKVTGADEIDPYLSYSIVQLKKAFENGQKLLLNAALETLRFAVTVVHFQEPDGINEEQNRKIIEKRKDTVENICGSIYSVVNKIYGDLFTLNIKEPLYGKLVDESDRIEKIIENNSSTAEKEMLLKHTPNELQKSISDNPNIIQLMHRQIELDMVIQQAEFLNTYIQNLKLDIKISKNTLDQLVNELKASYNQQGINYDSAQIQNTIRKLTDEAGKKVRDMISRQTKAYEASRHLQNINDTIVKDTTKISNAVNAAEFNTMYYKRKALMKEREEFLVNERKRKEEEQRQLRQEIKNFENEMNQNIDNRTPIENQQ